MKNWHSVEIDKEIDGLKVAQIGSMRYILNNKDRPVTLGAHSYYMEGSILYCKTGSQEQEVIYRNPNLIEMLINDRDNGDLLIKGPHGDKLSSNMVIADKSKLYENKTGHIHAFYISAIVVMIIASSIT